MLLKALLSLGLWTVLTSGLPTTTNIKESTEPALNFSSYAPIRIQCPERSQWLRPANGLSDEESSWVAERKKKILSSLSAYLQRLHLCDFDSDEYIQKLAANTSNVPTIGMAISGGGWAPALTSTGPLLAFDDRFGPSCEQRTGGILQSMTYLSGLSGGSWPVMSLSTYNFPTIQEMVGHWHVDQAPPLGSPNNTAYRVTPEVLFEQIVPKFKAGFNVSLMDMLGRGFAYEFVAGANGGMETMLSDVASLSNFQNHEMPFPMWQAFQGSPDDPEIYGLEIPSENPAIVEWSPFEFGSWDGPAAFFPTKYLGTTTKDGRPIDDECVVGFDRASFLLGAAADATNLWQIEAWSNGTLGYFSKRSESGEISKLTKRWNTISLPEAELAALEAPFNKYFDYTLSEMMYATVPNPFVSASSTGDHSNLLTLLDESEGEYGQSLPLWSQVQPARGVDFLMTWDDDEDTHPYNWNNGTNLYNSYVYATDHDIPFPVVPSVATFVNRGLLSRPVFFGCDASMTNTNDTRPPIIAYMTNAPYSAYTNYTWTNSQFSDEQMAVITTNGFNYATAGNGTLDAEWPECLGCAVIDRSLARVDMERTEQCQTCMAKYCWDGMEDNSTPAVIDMSLKLDAAISFAEWNATANATYWPEVSSSGFF